MEPAIMDLATQRQALINLYASNKSLYQRMGDSVGSTGHWTHVEDASHVIHVAVVDTGLDPNHVLFPNNLSPGMAYATDRAGQVRRIGTTLAATGERRLVRWVEGPGGHPQQQHTYTSHGTHVGGIVALTLGADRWQHYNIVPMAIGDRGVCLSGMAGEDEYPYNRPGLNVVAALRDLATEAYRAVKVVNLSWGFDFTNPDLRDALLALMNSHGGKLVVLSAGNGDEHGRGIQMTSDREEARNLRALLTLALHPDAHQRLIIVGATEAYEWVPYGLDYLGGYTLPIRRPCQEQSLYRDTPEMIRAVTAPSQYAGESLALFSNYPGASHLAQSVFICAPGEGVMSTVPAQADGIGVAIKGGTSMAAPVVSGLLAKALMSFPYLTVDDVRNLLFQTAGGCFLKDGSLRDRYGSGMVNADAFRRAAEALNLEKTPQLAAFSIVPYITYLNQILR